MKVRKTTIAIGVVALLGVVLSVIALTTIPSAGPPAHPRALSPATRSGHDCSPQQFFMQCSLPPAPRELGPTGPVLAYGVDFAWGAPSVERMRALGAKFGASYLSNDLSKNWTLAAVSAYHAAGIATVAVWESTANRATQGFAAGQQDARAAAGQAAVLGMPSGRPIIFAVDCECAGTTIAAYFDGVDSVLGVNRTDAYGSYYVVMYLYNTHRVSHQNWATYAWSYGQFPPASIAPLQQYLNDNSVDYDRALAADYGQWPYTPPNVARLGGWTRARDSSLRAWTHRGCTLRLARADCFTLGVRRVIYFQHRIDSQQQRPRCFGSHRSHTEHGCQVIRPYVSHWSHARQATRRAQLRNGCGNSRLCRVLHQRERYYTQMIHRNLY